MNVTGRRPGSSNNAFMESPDVVPSGKALVEGYRMDIMTGFEPERPRYNPVRQAACFLCEA